MVGEWTFRSGVPSRLQGGSDPDGLVCVPPGFVGFGALVEHSVEFVDQERNCLVALVRRYRRVHVRTVDFNVTLCGEPIAYRLLGVAFQFHPEPDDPFLVAKQSFGFLAHERLQGRRQWEVDAGYDEFGGAVIAIHVYYWVPFGGLAKPAYARVPYPGTNPWLTENLNDSAVFSTGGSSCLRKIVLHDQTCRGCFPSKSFATNYGTKLLRLCASLM